MKNLSVKPKKICYVTYLKPSFFLKNSEDLMGGSEYQQLIITRALKSRGWDISFVVQEDGRKYSGQPFEFEIIKSYSPDHGFPLLRFWYPMAYLWLKALNRANADIYIQEGACAMAGITAYFCQKKKKVFIFHIAAKWDVDGKFIKGKNVDGVLSLSGRLRNRFRNGYLYKYGLKHTDAIICQSKDQLGLLEKNYRIDGVLIPNGHILPTTEKNNFYSNKVIWIGNIRPVKRPLLFLELAKKMPDLDFKMIGGAIDKRLYAKCAKEAKVIPNIEFVGPAKREEMARHYKNTFLLVNTSDSEGFPNTFIEAWSYGVPTVSLNVDPDGCICKYGLGRRSGAFEKLILDIKLLKEKKDLWQQMSWNARRFCEENFAIDKVVDKYEKLFYQLLSEEEKG